MNKRSFSSRERTELWLASEGRCAICGDPLASDYQADHVKPWALGGTTDTENGQATCQKCNLKKGVNMLRQHQQEFLDVCRLIKTQKDLRRVIAWIVPGGGKSALPVIAAHELIPFLADGLAWISPRDNLRLQAETAFTAGWLRSLLGHTNEIRAAVNEADPLRDKIGYATTYQALTTALSYQRNPHVELFKRKRMALVLDELHHVAVGSDSEKALRPLVDSAAVLIIMSGAFTRHDGQRIAFIDYVNNNPPGRSFVDLNPNSKQAIIKYGLADATRERALIQINFELRDCNAAWDIRDDLGNVLDEGGINGFDGATNKDTSKGLFTALRTDFFESLLLDAADFWRDRRQHNPNSLFLVVAPYIGDAKRARKILKSIGINAAIATSEDSPSALTAIEQFRKGKEQCLVTVAMAYEGMDAPPADVQAALTHVRSKEWIEQMIHRVTRYDHKNLLPWEHQFATIFAPKDKFFVDIMAEMKAEQAPFVDESLGPPPPPPPPPPNGKLHPRQSTMTDPAAATFNDPPIDGDEHRHFTAAMKAAAIHGAIPITAAKNFVDAMKAQAASGFAPPPPDQHEDDVMPPSKREQKLRDQIVAAQRAGYRGDAETTEMIARRGKAMWRMFHKSLDELTETQLQAVLDNQDIWARP